MESSHAMPASSSPARLRRWAAAGVYVCLGSLLALTALQYVMPANLTSVCGLNHAGVKHFSESLFARVFPPARAGAFVILFRVLLGAAWLGYALAVVMGLRGGLLKVRHTLSAAALAGIALAVFWPASLSSDVYSYVGLARMRVLYGLNPYTHTLQALADRGDPVAGFAIWRIPSVYGGVWTSISVALVWLLQFAGLFWQVVALKVLEAGAVVAAALAGKSVAERFSPGMGNLTLLAIALNPLFLIEGPGSGHNDMLSIALLLAGASLLVRHRVWQGSLLVGISAGVKLLPLVVWPWVVAEYSRGRPVSRKMVLGLAVLVALLLPMAAGYAPFWEGASTLRAIGVRLAAAEHMLPVENSSAPAEPSQDVLQNSRFWLPGILFVALSAWVFLTRTPGAWLIAWVVFSAIALPAVMRVWFPWYFIAPWAVVLTRWDRFHLGLSWAFLVAMAALTIQNYCS